MTGRIIVHIGLPKTATTTLQHDVFPRLANPDTLYLGVRQPREVNHQDRLFKDVIAAVNGTEAMGPVRDQLRRHIIDGQTLLLSEEMLTVSQPGISWRDKLRHLALLLKDMNYALIVTVREPATALFSYYVELYPKFSRRGSFMECALLDDDMRIYHYKSLFDALLSVFERDRITVLRFEDIVENRLDSLFRLIRPDREGLNQILLGQQNARTARGNAVIARNSPPWLPRVLEATRRRFRALGLENGFITGLVRPVVRRLRKAASREVVIERPTPEDMDKLRDALRNETLALKQHLGVAYE